MHRYNYERVLHESAGHVVKLWRDNNSGDYIVTKERLDDTFVLLNVIELIEIIAQNPHTSIVKYRENATVDKEVMEFCTGGDLFEFVERSEGPFPERVIQRMMREILQGIAHLHSLTIAHRDISLENILLDDDSKCHICDFELAHLSGTHSRGRVGKEFYMAPEVNNHSNSYNAFKVDMWSVGIVFFILLTRYPPFHQASLEDANYQLFNTHGIVPLLENAQISDNAMDLLEKLLIVSPNQRLSIEEAVNHPYVAFQ